MVITTGWAFAVKSGEFSKVVPYLIAQVAGSFTAAVVVWIFYFPIGG